MKKYSILLLLVISCNINQENFELSGKINGLENDGLSIGNGRMSVESERILLQFTSVHCQLKSIHF